MGKLSRYGARTVPARVAEAPARSEGEPFALGTWRVDPATRTLSDGAVVRALSPRAMSVLAVLARADGAVVGRDTLMEAVWPHVTVGEESLTQAVAELRRALGDTSRPHQYVATVSKSGYHLLAPVSLTRQRQGLGDEELSLAAYAHVLDARRELLVAESGSLARAVEASARALELSPRSALANAQHAICLVYAGLYLGRGNPTLIRGLQHGDEAVRLRPDSVLAHAARGWALASLGSTQKAFAAFGRGFAIGGDDDGEAHYLAARSAYAAGEYRMAATLSDRAAGLDAGAAHHHFFAARAAAGYDAAQAARYARACHTRLTARLAAHPGEPRSLSSLGPILALMGETEAAFEAVQNSNGRGTVCSVHDVFGFAAMGERDAALNALEAAIDEGYRDARILGRETVVTNLMGGDVGFRRLVRAIKAP